MSQHTCTTNGLETCHACARLDAALGAATQPRPSQEEAFRNQEALRAGAERIGAQHLLREQASDYAHVADARRTVAVGAALGGFIHNQRVRTFAEQRYTGGAAQKTFSREEVLAVLKSRKAILVDRPHFAEAARELDTLVDVFQRME